MFSFDERLKRNEEEYGTGHIEGDYFEWWQNNPYKHQTMTNKIILGAKFRELKALAEYYIEYCKSIPEEESAHHAELVQKLKDDVVVSVDALGKTIHNDIYGK